jgi:two-component system, OmpR family, sensor histidine kinase KdpD
VLLPRRVPTSLSALVTGVTGDLATALRGHRLRLDLPTSLPPVDVDPTLIARVLTNLLENAIRHAPKGTPITITAAPWPGGTVLVSVADRGPGISQDRRDEVFGLLARRDADAGAGLGLTIARTFVAAHGQRIWVQDAEGGGARFCLTLPVAAGEPRPEPAAGAAPPAGPAQPEEGDVAAGSHR